MWEWHGRLRIAAALCSIAGAVCGTSMASGASFSFDNGNATNLMAAVSRQSAAGKLETETADDFPLQQETLISGATFTGLLTGGATAGSINHVAVEIYRVFPDNSMNPPSGQVPTRVNSPSDVAMASLDSLLNSLSFQTTLISASFTANNSVISGIHPIPTQTTGGEGAQTGQEVQLAVTFSTPFDLQAGHYFIVPQVNVTSGDFLWLSSSRPTTPPFTPDLQAWIRNAALAPDWLRIGTDIVGGATPPQFNMAFTLSGTIVPEPATVALLAIAVGAMTRRRRRVA